SQNERHLLAGQDVSRAAEVSTLGDQLIPVIDHFKVAIVQAVIAAKIFIERFGPGREENGVAPLPLRHVLVVTHPMPKLLGDKWQERVKKPQRVREDKVDDREGVGPAL